MIVLLTFKCGNGASLPPLGHLPTGCVLVEVYLRIKAYEFYQE